MSMVFSSFYGVEDNEAVADRLLKTRGFVTVRGADWSP
jgi:hypothetical protein